MRARQDQTIYSLGGIGGEYTDFDAIARVDATDPARLVFGLGVIARPLPGLSIGLSARPSEPVHATGTLDVQLPPFAAAAGATVTGHAGRVDFDLPPQARLGAQYATGPLTGEADVTWENWGVLKSMSVTPLDIVIHQGGADTKVGPIVVPRNWHAAWSARLGGEVELYPWLRLRAGALYEWSAIPAETLQIDFVSLSRLAATLGASAQLGKVTATLGLAHFFPQSLTVTDSQVQRIDPYPAPPFTIGNGQYQTSLDVVALQLAASL